jgi:hypothetical protein
MACRARTIPGCRTKKRLTLDSFSRAVKSFLAGASSGCKWEPKWSTLFPLTAKPEDSEEQKREAAERLEAIGLTCQKLLMNPAGCHGCPDNPIKADQDVFDQEAVAQHSNDLKLIDKLHTAARLGLLRLADMSGEEFEMLGLYYWETERMMRAQKAMIGDKGDA